MSFSMRSNPEYAYFLYKGGFGFCFALMTTIFSLYHIQTVGLNPLQLILVGAVLEGACFLLELPTGIVADMYSRKKSLIMGLMIMGLGLMIEGFFPVFLIILLAQVVWGGGATFLSGADAAWLADEVGPDKFQKILLRGFKFQQLGTILGIVSSVALAKINLQVPMVSSGVGFIILGIILAFLMTEKGFKAKSTQPESKIAGYLEQLRSGVGHLRKPGAVIPFFTTIWLAGLYSEGIDRLWVFHLTEDIGLETFHFNELYWFAIIQIVLLILNFGVIGLIENRIEQFSTKQLYGLMAVNNLVLLLGIVGFALSSNFYAALATFWLLMVSRGVNDPISTIIVNTQIEDATIRATVLSFKGLADQIGQIIGGLLVGYIALVSSVSYGLLSSSVFIVGIVFILFILYFRESEGR